MNSVASASSVPSGPALYRSFIERCEEELDEFEPAKGIAFKACVAKCPLPYVTTGEDALKLASAFRATYMDGNPAHERIWSGNRAVTDCLLGSSSLMLSDYMPKEDNTLEGLRSLVEMESVDCRVSPLDLLYEQISTGIKSVLGRDVTLRKLDEELDAATVERALGRTTPEGVVCIWSELRRKSDGAMPAQNERPDGLRGFIPDEDPCLALYERYRKASPADRFAAVEELKAAISFAIDPRRQRAGEVPYSLLDALEASGHRAVLRSTSSNEILLAESHSGLSRCMSALRAEGH